MGGDTEVVSRRKSSKRHSKKHSDRKSKSRSAGAAGAAGADEGKRHSGKRKKSSKKKKTYDMLTLVGVTAWTYSSMLVMFCTVYVMHWVLDNINKLRRKKLPKRDEVMLMGSVFRQTSAKFVVDLNPFWEVKVTTSTPLEDMPAGIYVGNHMSYADPFFVCAAQRPLETKYVGKGDLFELPVAGKALEHSGDMPVHFVKDKQTGKWRAKEGTIDALMQQAGDYLDQGISLTVFPEGTCSRDGGLLPFKKGFFKLAVEKGVPIIPFGMWGTHNAWPMKEGVDSNAGGNFMQPASINVNFGDPIPSEGSTVDQLVEDVFDAVQTLRNACPNCDIDESMANRLHTDVNKNTF